MPTSDRLFSDRSLVNNPTQDEILNAKAELGMFADDGRTVESFMTEPPGVALGLGVLNGLQSIHEQGKERQSQILRAAEANQLAEKKRAQLEEAARLKAGEKYRKDPLLRNADGTLKQDSDVELWLKQKLNTGLELWNRANDIIPNALVEDKTLDIDSRFKGTVAGMAHEDLQNKDLFGIRGMSKKDVLNDVNRLQDDPSGQGTLYYLRKQDGVDENGQPKYLYKAGYAQLDAADRYRSQANAAGWDIVKEVQSSGSAEAEKKIHAMFINDRTLSYGMVKGADGKLRNHDEASGINFGSGYGEIYNKDILGWDKKLTQADVNKYKAVALKNAVSQGLRGEQLNAYRASLNNITPDQLKQMQLDANKERSYAKRDKNDVYESTHYKDDAWTAAKTGLTKIGREAADTVLDVITPSGMTQESSLGQWLQSDGKGNSERLDKWKSQEEVDKYTNFNRRSEDEVTNAIVYNYKQGNYVGMLGEMFSGGVLNVTAESLGYIAPMLVGSMIAAPFSGGSSGVAATGGIAARVGSLFGRVTQAKNVASEAGIVGDAVTAANAGKQVSAATAEIESAMQATAGTMARLAKTAEAGGFYGQSAAMANERIDQRIKNNGGQPTTLLENAMVFGETVLENYIDRAVDLGVLGMANKTALQDTYKLLDDVAKKNLLTKAASRAVALTASAGVEAGTEYVQAIGQSLAEEYDTKKNSGTVSGILSNKENQEEYLVNFLIGGAAGIHMQSIPSTIGIVKDGGVKLINKFDGTEAKEIRTEKVRQLSKSILSGTASPSTITPITGDTSQHAIADIVRAATEKGAIPASIAGAVIREASDGHIGEFDDGVVTKQSSEEIIGNVAKTLRATFNINDDSTSDNPTDLAQYEYSAYRSALSTLKSIMNIQDGSKPIGDDGELADSHRRFTEHVLATALNSYAKVYPDNIMSKVKLMISDDIITTLEKKSAHNDSENTVGEDLDQKIATYTLDMKSLSEALSSMNAVMGSDGGISNGSDGIKDNDVKESLGEIFKQLKKAITDAEKNDGTTIVSGSFFNQLKTAASVGSEILLSGRANENGSVQGMGTLTYADKITNEIREANDKAASDKFKILLKSGKKELAFNPSLLEKFVNFSTGRFSENKDGVLRDESVLAPDSLYTYNELVHKEDGKRFASKKFNYLPQMDLTGSTLKQKEIEISYFNDAINQIRSELALATDIPSDEKKYIEDQLKIAEESQSEDIIKISDSRTANTNTDGTRKGDHVVINIGKAVAKRKDAIATKTAKIDELKKLDGDHSAEIKKLSTAIVFIKRELAYLDPILLKSKGDDRFSGDVPVFAYVDRKKAGLPNKPYDASSKTKDTVSDNSETEKDELKDSKQVTKKEDIKDEQDEATDESDREREASGKSSESAEDSEDDKQRIEKHSQDDQRAEQSEIKDSSDLESQEADGSKKEFADKINDESLLELEKLTAESIQICNDIAESAGVEFNYDTSDNATLASNLKELRKAITKKVNEFKKEVRDSIKSSFDKSDKLAVLLTSAVKGLSLDEVSDKIGFVNNKYLGIQQEDKIKHAKEVNDIKKTASLAHNDSAKNKAHKAKVIIALRKKIDESSGHTKRLYINKLAVLLGIPVPKNNTIKQEPRGIIKQKSNIDNDREYENIKGYEDPYAGYTKEHIAELNRLNDENLDLNKEEVIKDDSSIADETVMEEVNNTEIKEDGVDAEEHIHEEDVVLKAVEEALDKNKNMFAADIENMPSAAKELKENSDNINAIKSEMYEANKEEIDAEEKRLREAYISFKKKSGVSELLDDKGYNSEAKKLKRQAFDNVMKKKFKDC